MAKDAVSRKIRKLRKEGKPQKQAEAIALSMKRRGELNSPPQGIQTFFWNIESRKPTGSDRVPKSAVPSEPAGDDASVSGGPPGATQTDFGRFRGREFAGTKDVPERDSDIVRSDNARGVSGGPPSDVQTGFDRTP